MDYSTKSNIYKTVDVKCAKTRASVLVVFSLMLISILFAIALFLSPRIVEGISMRPTFNATTNSGDIVYIIKQRAYHRGDIVVLSKNETQSNRDVIKRIIGIEGDKVEIREELNGLCKVYINNKPYNEDYVSSQQDIKNTKKDFDSYRKSHNITENYITVGKGEIFVLGDNRASFASYDSADYGTRKVSEVEGRVLIVIPDSTRFFSLKIFW